MILEGEEWGHVFNASGARGFAGEGYWFHRLWKPFGLNFAGSTFVAKTTTLHRRHGNMPLAADNRPMALLPDCIRVLPSAGVVLNAVGLSGPGVGPLVGLWTANWLHGAPELKPRFVVSIMSVAKEASERRQELRQLGGMVGVLARSVGRSRVALQVNLSCPNAGIDPTHLLTDWDDALEAGMRAGVATMVKINAMFPVRTVTRLAVDSRCAAVVVSNTIPWGGLSDRIDWQKIFGTRISPLAKYGGGGMSGRPLLPLVAEWIREARQAGLTKPVVGGGGVLDVDGAELLLSAGATAIELGSVAILRPWRVRRIVRYVNRRMRVS